VSLVAEGQLSAHAVGSVLSSPACAGNATGENLYVQPGTIDCRIYDESTETLHANYAKAAILSPLFFASVDLSTLHCFSSHSMYPERNIAVISIERRDDEPDLQE
jgi:hypothetical protein